MQHMQVVDRIYQQPQFGENWFSFDQIYRSVVDIFPSGSTFVEVGSWKGKSAAFMAVEIANAEKHIEFWCIDRWDEVPDLYSTWRINMGPLKQYHHEMKSDSVKASKTVDNECLDFVFIDTSPIYKDVREDIKAWIPKVRPGGIIAGNHYENGYDGVVKAVDENLKGKEFDVYQNCWIHKKQ